jgi:peroxiredoxin
MPALEKIHAAHPDSDLRMVGVVVLDRAPYADIKAALEASKASYRVVVDSAKNAQRAFGGIATVPTTFLLDDQGKIVRKFVGTSAKQLEALAKDVDDVLAGRPLGAPYLPSPDEPAPATR